MITLKGYTHCFKNNYKNRYLIKYLVKVLYYYTYFTIYFYVFQKCNFTQIIYTLITVVESILSTFDF